MKYIKKSTALLLLITLLVSLTACGKEKEITGADHTVEYEYAKKLDDDTFYIRHQDLSCERLYNGEKTFSGSEDKPDPKRLFWFTEETFQKIPTLYEGDSLIFKSKEHLLEEFTFERFNDFGYSVGLALLKVADSGRLKISTEKSDHNTYPYGDTDVILNEIENDYALIDKITEEPIRVIKDANGNWITDPILTKAGTIKNLKKDTEYLFELYSGTYKYTYSFVADKRVLSSAEVGKTYAYEFETAVLINIALPQNLRSGYYMINGVGLFRYVAAKDLNIDPNTNPEAFSQDNGWNESTENISKEQEEVNPNPVFTPTEGCKEKEFTIAELNTPVTVSAKLINCENIYPVEGEIEMPDGEILKMSKELFSQTLTLSFTPPMIGKYIIRVKYLNDADFNLMLQYEEEE